jgi:hypothetical protein
LSLLGRIRLEGGIRTCEARAEQADFLGAGRFPQMGRRHPDVVEDSCQRQFFLLSFAFTVAAKVEAERRQAGLGQSDGEPREEVARAISP